MPRESTSKLWSGSWPRSSPPSPSTTPRSSGSSSWPPRSRPRLQSCLKTGQRGSSFLKLKLNWDRAHFWDVEGQPIEDPGDLSGRECRLSVELRQVWLMNPQCGLLLEVRDVQLREREPSAAACPFK